MESFQPCQVPSLNPVKEHRLHHCFVKLSRDPWCCVLPSQHLASACPYPPSSLADLLPHGLDVGIILSNKASKELEHLDSLKNIPM